MADSATAHQSGVDLDAVQEHYLKRELLKFELEQELQELNDHDALRKFGFPFTASDPKKVAKEGSRLAKSNSQDESLITQSASESMKNTDFPMLNYLLRKFVMTFPLFAKNVSIDESFWQTKVQVFFEHFTDLGFSDSYDLEQATKRKKLGQKFSKLILLLFNSGVGTSQEKSYYEMDKEFSLKNETRKRSKIEDFTIPTKENIQNLITNEPFFINGWDVNIVAVIDDSVLGDIAPLSNPTKIESSSSASMYGVGSLKSTHRWMKDTFAVQTSKTSLFSKLSLNGSASESTATSSNSSPSKKKAITGKTSFIVRVRNIDSEEATYVVKSYKAFKKLADSLIIQFPGKKLPHVPHKIKRRSHLHKVASNTSVSSRQSVSSSLRSESSSQVPYTIDQSFDDDKDTTNQDEEELDQDETDVMAYGDLMDDKLRTSLRQYLRSLCRDEEVAISSTLVAFFDTDKISSLDDLDNSVIKSDIKKRANTDISNLETQLNFQKLALEKSLILQDSMKEFKTKLLKDDSYLLDLANEIKEKTSITQLSPIFQDFIEWFKIYFSSLIFQTFIGNDNSYGLYTQIRRLHKLMPYTMMEQIVKFTNPMAIMKGMIDLFMAQPPQILGGGQSLLQTMFSTILTDDLKVYKARVKDLEELVLQQCPDKVSAKSIMKCLKEYVLDKSGKVKPFSIEDVHAESVAMGMPVVLIILMKYDDMSVVSNEAVTQVIESYTSWKVALGDAASSIAPDSKSSSPGPQLDKSAQYFQHIKELYALYMKEHDKRLMRQLWQDSELQSLLKAIVTLIYEPMVRVFKVAKMDVALRNFERFMSDLIKLLDMIMEGRTGANTQFNIIDSIYNLVTRHQDSFFEFLHDVYVNDTEQIFEGFILWFAKIIKFLQTSKYGDDDKRIDVNALIASAVKDASVELDAVLLKDQIDAVIKKKVDARKIYKEIVDLRTKEETANASNSKNGQPIEHVMDKKWKEINDSIMPENTMNAGLADGELVDLDIDTKDFGYLKKEKGNTLEDQYNSVLAREIDESEIQKLRAKYMVDILRDALSNETEESVTATTST
ncbi:hypothetical protein DAKH74_041950 [Maudiozyma humilis]|uniref:PX domain-containing protein n=1 Tax=Maudiozyma humilis TaxID=51915 RepID=A0AAV5S157_MAUHU|nr:hypothetical protein DAKH74_041950 [Kazachstania humilis]